MAAAHPPSTRDEDPGRTVVGPNFEVFKQWQGLATPYDKLALTHRGTAVGMATTVWSKALRDTP